MAGLYLWSPCLLPDIRSMIEVIVTRGETSGIADGTSEFARAVLEGIGVKADVSAWTVTPCRTKYFSEYLGEPDWRDNWQLVWKIRIQTTMPVDRLPELKQNGIGTDAGDNSWSPDKRVKDDDAVRCLVIADFKTENARSSAEAAVAQCFSADVRERYRVGPPELRHARIPPKIEQLQIDLGLFAGRFYADGADYAETVMDACKKAKGTVHFQQRP
jgi:hypothetical protein